MLESLLTFGGDGNGPLCRGPEELDTGAGHDGAIDVAELATRRVVFTNRNARLPLLFGAFPFALMANLLSVYETRRNTMLCDQPSQRQDSHPISRPSVM